jgi:hypothetical protein
MLQSLLYLEEIQSLELQNGVSLMSMPTLTLRSPVATKGTNAI